MGLHFHGARRAACAAGPAVAARRGQRTLLHAFARLHAHGFCISPSSKALQGSHHGRPCHPVTTLPPSVTAGQSYHPDAGQENRRLLQACRRLTMQFLLSFRGVSCSYRPSLTLIHPRCRPSRNWGELLDKITIRRPAPRPLSTTTSPLQCPRNSPTARPRLCIGPVQMPPTNAAPDRICGRPAQSNWRGTCPKRNSTPGSSPWSPTWRRTSPRSPCWWATASSSTGSAPSTPAKSRRCSEICRASRWPWSWRWRRVNRWPARRTLGPLHPGRPARRPPNRPAPAATRRRRRCATGSTPPPRPSAPGPPAAPAAESASAGRDEAPQALRHRLNAALTFETLVEGSANRMARSAGMHVAGMPGHLYNPLFVYGGVGLGKTHLVHAVGNRLLASRPQAKVLYVQAEEFVWDVVRSYQRRTFDEFKERYHSLDLLLIDDVQFFANKDRTQEEFFNAFEALLTKKSHLVMTSDTYPKGLSNIHERLVSRFDSGLTVAIEPPELEMRVAILINKAQAESTERPEEVAFFVAKNVRSNVRELEGALRKILAYSRFNQKEISIQLAREAVRDLLSIQNRQISVENIQKTVADYYKSKVADMYSKKRPASIARPRQIAMHLTKELTQKSLPEIGESFGGRDHTTVLHAVRKIAAERQQLTELNQQLHVLEQTLKG